MGLWKAQLTNLSSHVHDHLWRVLNTYLAWLILILQSQFLVHRCIALLQKKAEEVLFPFDQANLLSGSKAVYFREIIV